jgi:predicted nucleotidyltransferase
MTNVRVFGSMARGDAGPQSDRAYLKHILRCIERIEEYTAGRS